MPLIQESVSKSRTSNLLNRVVNQINAAASNSSATTGTTTTTAQAAAAFMKFSGLGSAAEREKEKERPGEDPVREEDGRLSVDVAEKMLKWHAEAVGRCVELSPTSDVCVLKLNLLTSLFNKDVPAPRTRSRSCEFSRKHWAGPTSRPRSRREYCLAPICAFLIFTPS